VQSLNPVAGEFDVTGGNRHGGGQPLRDFGGEAGAGEYAAGGIGPEFFGDDLVRQLGCAGFKALAGPQQRRCQGLRPCGGRGLCSRRPASGVTMR
jgi:hypothetical protein